MSIVHDLRQSIRTLAKSPGFTAVTITTLGLSIGGSTAVFTVVDSVLLRPLNFAEPERLTQIVVRPSIRPDARSRLPRVSIRVASREPSLPRHSRMVRRAGEPHR